MSFNSIVFAIFLPIVFILYWMLPHKYRWGVLLISSYYFYMSWNAKYVILILFTTAISYACAIALEKFDSIHKKRIACAATLIASLGVLLFFKYFNFFSNVIIDSLNSIALDLDPVILKIMLPVGISFYTFQTLGYVIDVYRGDIKAEKNFGIYATFVSFFPQLVAGPIERSRNLLPQIRQRHVFDYDMATYGLKLMAWGFFKKIVIADNLAPYVNQVYNNIDEYTGFAIVIAMVMFSFQLYCDFSGYSDIAIGTSKLFGINLMTNFKSVYFSSTIKEFWTRNHISLTTWFKDYLYIPLGGSKKGKFRHYINIMIVFIVSGFWHGANWTFVLWGGLHGALQILEDNILKIKSRTFFQLERKSFRAVSTWILMVIINYSILCTLLILFRANNINDAYYVITHMLDGVLEGSNYIFAGFSSVDISKATLLFLSFPVILLLLYEFFSLGFDLIGKVKEGKWFVRWCIYVLFVVIIVLFSYKEEGAAFIYFQF